jgi:hypothetical protein
MSDKAENWGGKAKNSEKSYAYLLAILLAARWILPLHEFNGREGGSRWLICGISSL